MIVGVIGVLSAIAIPAYQDYTVRTIMTENLNATQRARDALGQYYQHKQEIPGSLEAIKIPTKLPNGSLLSLNTDNMIFTVTAKQGTLIFVPREEDNGTISWTCSGGEDTPNKYLPAQCRSTQN